MRGRLAILTFGAVLTVPGLARAQGECPDGWFCEPEAASEDDAAADNDSGPDLSPQSEAGDADTPKKPRAKPRGPIVYQPADEGRGRQIIIVDRPENAPPPPRRRNYREWGLNLRLEGVLMDDDGRHEDASMGGLGVSLRYRPIPYFAFDAGLDFISGTDWAGNERRETALLLSGMVFFNPYSKVQFYTLGGIGFSGAEVTLHEPDVKNADGTITKGSEFEEKYRYFGAHLGLGLEFRVSRKVALNLDVLGFIRGRTDRLADEQPEFVDKETGRVTNTSGGGLARAGITFYW
jgi:opacity protein-like surface antigen